MHLPPRRFLRSFITASPPRSRHLPIFTEVLELPVPHAIHRHPHSFRRSATYHTRLHTHYTPSHRTTTSISPTYICAFIRFLTRTLSGSMVLNAHFARSLRHTLYPDFFFFFSRYRTVTFTVFESGLGGRNTTSGLFLYFLMAVDSRCIKRKTDHFLSPGSLDGVIYSFSFCL